MRLRLGVGAAVLLVLLILVACGSREGFEATAISRGEFVAKARAICSKGSERIAAYYGRWGAKARRHADPEEFMNGVAERIVIPVRTAEVREMRALGLPAAGKEKLEAFLKAIEEGIERGKEDRRSLRGGNYAFQKALDIAGEVGLMVCFVG